jgi:phenylacetate-CoA ligase
VIEDRLYPLLKFYMEAPQWVKSLAGSVYRLMPGGLRHGPKYRNFIDELELTDPGVIQARLLCKMAETLTWATATVPFYREAGVRIREDEDPFEVWRRFPVVTKQMIKENPDTFLSTSLPADQRLYMYTGGSTSVPMRIAIEKNCSRAKELAYARAFDRIAGIGRGDVILALRGRTVPGAGQGGGRMWMFDPIKKYLHLSSDHLEPRFMPAYVDVLRQWRPTFVHAFPSAIYPLARWLAEHPAPEVTGRVRAIQLFSENVYAYQVELLEQVFGCQILLDYGHSERAVKAVSRIGDKRYRFWPLYGKVELLDLEGQAVTQAGALGEIVATGFDNRAMPFIRYRTGDLGVLAAPGASADGELVLERIEGRLQEFLVCGDHRLISICTIGAAHFEYLSEVEQMQFEQLAPGRATLKVVSSSGVSAGMTEALKRGILEKTQGGIEVEVISVPTLARTVAGKHKLLIQHLDLTPYLGAAAIEP